MSIAIRFIHRHFKTLILGGAIFLIFSVFLFGSKPNERKADASTYNVKYFTCIDIEYGETLYDIADRYISEEYHSKDEYVSEVMNINGLTSTNITSGATLVVPYYAAP
ncbi:MAG: LysM peptidoglycan-binding domain-containing protein [Wujia sp.]